MQCEHPSVRAARRRRNAWVARHAPSLPSRIALAAILAVACERDPASPADDLAEGKAIEASETIGTAACASCHPAETARWRGSHHDLAMQNADEETVLGDFENANFTYFGRTTTFSKRDQKFVVQTDGPNGDLREYEIAYTFGVEPLQQYLVAFDGGRLQPLGIAWDTRSREAGGQRWFSLYPESPIRAGDPLHWTGRIQTWNHMCADCHSTNLRKNYDLSKDSYETTWSAIDVSCEACHGAGSEHAAWARARDPAEPEPSSDPLLKLHSPARWHFEAGARIATRSPAPASPTEVETCARCHARRGQLYEGFAPGDEFLDYYLPALLDEGLYHVDGQMLDEVYVYGSFVQSPMYAAGVSCSDCHEPHGLTLRAEGNSLCGRCHDPNSYDQVEHHFHEPDAAGSRCVDCHMPSRTYMGVDSRRDHGFRVPRPDLAVRFEVPDPCTACHTGASASWAASEIRTRFGPERPGDPHFAEAIDAGRRGLPEAERLLTDLADRGAAPIVRATALRLLRERLGSTGQGSVERALRSPSPLVRIAATEASEALDPRSRLARVAPLLRDPVRAVRVVAARQLAEVPANLWEPRQRAALANALAEYRESQELNADLPFSHVNLGSLHAAFGETDAARSRYETALRLDPSFTPASVDLADLARRQGRDTDGEKILRKALSIDPASAAAHHALGLLLVRTGRTIAGLESLARAAELAPEIARYGYVHGIALNDQGRAIDALAVLTGAHGRHPDDRNLLVALATVNRDAGQREAALEFARKLLERSPNDPAARALVGSLESARP